MSKWDVCCVVQLKHIEDSEWRVDISHYDELKDKLLHRDDHAGEWVELRSMHDPNACLLVELEDIKLIFRSTELYVDAVRAAEAAERFMGGSD